MTVRERERGHASDTLLEAVEEMRSLQQGYLDQSDRATADDWPSRTWPGRLKVNLAKLCSPLL